VISKDKAPARKALVLAEELADIHCDRWVFRYYNLLALNSSSIPEQLGSDKRVVRKMSGFSTSCH
jgi:hypothetical protein